MSKTVELAKALIKKPSITPEDKGCQTMLIERLKPLGFKIENMNFGDVENFWARRGTEEPVLAFAGHTDVVPTGPHEEWDSDPFTPEVRNGNLYGRGTADMKASLAAMITAVESFIGQHPNHHGSIAILITSDEEGRAINGTRKVMEQLEERNEKITWCLVGEPSSSEKLGDTIKIGRRGSLSAELIVYGHQGHIAYPQLADNPIHRAAEVLSKLCSAQWDQGNDSFPPTSLQFSNINSGTGASNVIPGKLTAHFNFRYSTETTHSQLKKQVEDILDSFNFEYEIIWTLYGEPFYTQKSELIDACRNAIEKITGCITTLSTSGGTSDGRFIAPTGAHVVELGPVNASIHKINEHIKLEDIDTLVEIYRHITTQLLT